MKVVRFGTPVIGKKERANVREVLKHRALTNAGQVVKFEEAFTGFIGGGISIAVSSCTAALHLSMLAFGIGRGDEVIVPALTFVATAHAVELVGAKPVFADSWHENGNIDPEEIKRLLSPKTKAVIVVHYLGRPCYMRSIIDVCRSYNENIKIIEDCALALGARHWERHVGLIGDAGCFSFHPVKHITTGEGGMFVSKHPDIAEKAKLAREFGKLSDPNYPYEPYDVVSLGLNYRMTEMQAALGLAQLESYGERQERRERNYRLLRHYLGKYNVLDSDDGSKYAVTVILPEGTDRSEVIQLLRRRLIEPSIYYPGPVPLLSYYRGKYGYGPGGWPVAEKIAARGITLPVGPHLGDEHMAQIVSEFRVIVKEMRDDS